MHPTILTIGLITAFTTPKIRATPTSVRILDVSEAACSSMPGTTAVATARAAAEASTRSRKRMPHLGITDRAAAPGGRSGQARARRARYTARQARERASTTADRYARRVRELPERLDRAAELAPWLGGLDLSALPSAG